MKGAMCGTRDPGPGTRENRSIGSPRACLGEVPLLLSLPLSPGPRSRVPGPGFTRLRPPVPEAS